MRYVIIENYSGLFDSKCEIAYCKDLFHCVYLVGLLNRLSVENPCYSFDFKKLALDLDENADFYPADSFDEFGFVLDCKNYEDFEKKLLEKKFKKNL